MTADDEIRATSAHRAGSWDEYDRLIALFDAGEIDEEPEMPAGELDLDAAAPVVAYSDGAGLTMADLAEEIGRFGVDTDELHALTAAQRRAALAEAVAQGGYGEEDRAELARLVKAWTKSNAPKAAVSASTMWRRQRDYRRAFLRYLEPRLRQLQSRPNMEPADYKSAHAALVEMANIVAARNVAEIRRCIQCGEPLEADIRSDARFCSKGCADAHRRGGNPTAVRLCAGTNCSRPVDSPRSKYCGEVCRAVADRKRKRRTRSASTPGV